MGTTMRGPSGVLDPRRRLEIDQEALLEQPPAQVVRDLEGRVRRRTRIELAQRARRLLGVELHQTRLLAVVRNTPWGVRRAVQRRPSPVLTMRVGQRLGRRVERARGVLLGHLEGTSRT